MTVQATVSKHRRKDVLPLHPDLGAMLKEWTDGLGPDDPLFPKLARRRTWLMVKKDLERAGIPYETAEGIADFHADCRHTNTTGLLNNGSTLAEAKELARHADVKLTILYTHIGIRDQAKALATLPAPCQDIVRKPAVSGRREASAGDADRQSEAAGKNDASRCGKATSDARQQKKAPSNPDGALWRRRELNEQAHSRNELGQQEVTATSPPLSANRQHSCDREWLRLASSDARLMRVVSAWDQLPDCVRDAVEALCHCPMAAPESSDSAESRAIDSSANSELAEIVACWTSIPASIRQALLRIVRSQENGIPDSSQSGRHTRSHRQSNCGSEEQSGGPYHV